MKYLNFWPNTRYNLLTKFPTAITHFYKQKTEGNFLHTHMHYVIYAKTCVHMRSKIYIRICTMFLSTVCICAAKLSRQKAITFYMFHIFYTMGNVSHAIVYDYKTNKLCTLVENKQRFTLKITWVAKTKHFIYPPFIIVHYD